ncbi:class I SAM-dependent methyltransferase [Streptomyces sp. NPDC006326]|uniref:class I SAM-dependent methyltransferase n=1 Tax=Streptomyces sp. NPDC006326 TaxID=3156752 RepID=UPI0033B3175D
MPPRTQHPVFARLYARASSAAERHATLPALREELLHGVTGRVIEIGAGNGLSFAHYPRAVSEVVAVEPEPLLRRLAADAALHTEVPVDIVPGSAEALPVKSEAFDTAVASLVLCSVRDLRRSLSELHRVLRPDAELRFFEHGRAPTRGMAAVQRALDRTVWPHLFGGCHTAREPLAAIEAAGFRIVSCRSFRLPARGPAFPTSYCVIGSARRPFRP